MKKESLKSINIKAMKITLVIVFLIFSISYLLIGIVSGLSEGLIGALLLSVLSLLLYLPIRIIIETELNFTWWQKTFYIIGWIFGVFNIGFWIIMIITHNAFDFGNKFFGEGFHRRVYKWGIFVSLLIIFWVFFLFINKIIMYL